MKGPALNLTLVSKVVEDVAVVAGAVAAALTQSHDPVTVVTVAASAPAVRGLLASLISGGRERSLVGAASLLRSLLPAPQAAGDAPAGDAPVAEPPAAAQVA